MKLTRPRVVLIGIATTIAFAGMWQGPLGTGKRFAERADQIARQTLDYYELPQIKAVMQTSPDARRMLLSGPADDFQRTELLRIMNDIPGIVDVRWVRTDGSLAAGGRVIPLAIEAQLLGLLGFVVGMIVAYLLELRRRANLYKMKI